MKGFTLLLILAYLAPYGVAQEVPLYETITDNVPKIGITSEVYLGDRMLEQRTGDYRECITPKNDILLDVRGEVYHFLSNKGLCKNSADSVYYYANYTLYSGCRGIEDVGTCIYFNSLNTPVLLKEKDTSYELNIGFSKLMGNGYKFDKRLKIENIDNNDIKIDSRYFLYQANSFQQTIEYAGKSANQLKFIYSEFNHGFARDAFTREFQVDLNEGNIAAFKGALIEIEEATNVNIRYKVIRNFQD